MNRTELISSMSDETNLSYAEAKLVLSSITENIVNALKRGEKVKLRGFGLGAGRRRKRKSEEILLQANLY